MNTENNWEKEAIKKIKPTRTIATGRHNENEGMRTKMKRRASRSTVSIRVTERLTRTRRMIMNTIVSLTRPYTCEDWRRYRAGND